MPPLRLAGHAREPRLSAPAPVTKGGGYSGTPGLFFGLGLSPSSTGTPVTPYTAVGVSAVYACVKRISEDIAKLPMRVLRRQSRGFAVDADHPLNRIFRRPNRWQTHSQAWQFAIASLTMRGNGIAAVFRGDAGEPLSFTPIPFDRVSVMQGTNSGDLYYRFTHPYYPGQVFNFHQDNIVHLKGGTFDGVMGVPAIYQAPDVFGLALGAQTHGAVLFRQGAQLNGFLRHPNRLSAEAKRYISNSFDDRFAGVQQAHRTMVLEEGMEFVKVQMTNEDAQFLETRKFSVVEVCRMFSMPPHKIGDLEEGHYNNVEQGEQIYVNDCLDPIVQQVQEVFGHAYLFDDERDRYRISVDYRALLRGDSETRSKVYHAGITDGWMTRNEARLEEDLEITEAALDEFVIPLNMGGAKDEKGEAPAAGTAGEKPGQVDAP